MSQVIFILEDDPDIARVMARALDQQGYEARCFRRCAEFTHAIARARPDLCLIDLSLPDGDGLSVVTQVLSEYRLPAIIVSGRGDLADKVVGLEVGADDYIVKPFEPRELTARVRAVLRRSAPTPKQVAREARPRIARFNDWVVDFSACTLTGADGVVQELSAAETNLLMIFLSSSGRVLKRSQLLDADGHNDIEPFDRSIDARVSRLRRKLDDSVKSPKLIRTVYGAGYVFVADVVWD